MSKYAHIFVLKKFTYFRHSEFQTPCSSFFVVQNRVKSETAKMSMHFYSTSQKVLFDMEADLFSAIFVICICVDLESVCILLLTTLCQRFLTARPTAFEFPCGFKYLIPLGCFESPPNSSSLSKSKCHEEL